MRKGSKRVRGANIGDWYWDIKWINKFNKKFKKIKGSKMTDNFRFPDFPILYKLFFKLSLWNYHPSHILMHILY